MTYRIEVHLGLKVTGMISAALWLEDKGLITVKITFVQWVLLPQTRLAILISLVLHWNLNKLFKRVAGNHQQLYLTHTLLVYFLCEMANCFELLC